jgi:hypothetical protein
MIMMDYRWTKAPAGQYVDGHEREDVVEYQQNVFLPTMASFELKLRLWNDGLAELDGREGRQTVIWWHDESIFYANDRQKVHWVHVSETATPKRKGEGVSIMVADFVSADYGWLQAPNGANVRVVLKPGKGREGYFTNERFLQQVRNAMDILEVHYPNEDHVFVFDNATTHLKQAEDAISARSMPKWPSQPGKPNFQIERTVCDASGNVVYTPGGKPAKEKVNMAGGRLPDGSPQSFYFPEGHEKAGRFKGMAVILEERGYANAAQLLAQCKDFNCPKVPEPERQLCCCRRILYNEPDFKSIHSLVEQECIQRNFKLLFLPKFHCELNFIEQCWGYAKCVYRNFPPSKSETEMEIYIMQALASVPVETMRQLVFYFECMHKR